MNRLNKMNSEAARCTFHTVLTWLLLLVYVSPLYVMLCVALKTKEEFAKSPFAIPKQIVWQNIAQAAKKMDFLNSALNSAIVTFVSIAFNLVFAAWAGYVLARKTSKLYKNIYIFFLFGLMIPFPLIMLPLYKTVSTLGLMGNYFSVILVYTGTSMPVAIIILTSSIKMIPRELDEAALIDGAGPFRVFWNVIWPLIKAPVVTVMIICMVQFWNDLLTPMLFLGSRHQTLIMSLYNFKGALYTTDWTMVFAGSLIAMLPLLVIFFTTQKSFIKGMISGAVKG